MKYTHAGAFEMDTTESEPKIRGWVGNGVLMEKGRVGSSRNQSVGGIGIKDADKKLE